MGKRFDFVRTCSDEAHADYVINSVVNEYSKSPDWKIGEKKKEVLSNGDIKVTIELTKLEKENTAGYKKI